MWKIICIPLMLSVLLVEQCLARPLLVGRSEGMGFQVEEVVGGLGVPLGNDILEPVRTPFY